MLSAKLVYLETEHLWLVVYQIDKMQETATYETRESALFYIAKFFNQN